MNICVFGKYKVKRVNVYDIRTYVEGDALFKTHRERSTKTVDGCELIKRISSLLNHHDVIECRTDDNTIRIDYFNPHDGTGQTITYTITEIKEANNGNGKRTKNSRKIVKNNP